MLVFHTRLRFKFKEMVSKLNCVFSVVVEEQSSILGIGLRDDGLPSQPSFFEVTESPALSLVLSNSCCRLTIPQRPQCGIDRATCPPSLSSLILYLALLLLLLFVLSFIILLHLSCAAALAPKLLTDLFWYSTPLHSVRNLQQQSR